MARKRKGPDVDVAAYMQGPVGGRMGDAEEFLDDRVDEDVAASQLVDPDRAAWDRVNYAALTQLNYASMVQTTTSQRHGQEIAAALDAQYQIADDARGVPIRVFAIPPGQSVPVLNVDGTLTMLEALVSASTDPKLRLQREYLDAGNSFSALPELADPLHAEAGHRANQRVLQTLGTKYAKSFEGSHTYAVPPKPGTG